MKLRVLIPARRFHDAKSRLSPLLSSEERADLARDLLANLLTCVHEASPDAERLVLTNDSEVMELAQEFGAAVRRDDPALVGHGPQLRAAISEAPTDQGVIVLMADLPLFKADDLVALFESGEDGSVVLAPDRQRMGTNAAFFPVPSLRRPHFGHADSFERHLAAFADTRPAIVERVGLSHDLDDENDLLAILAQSPPTNSLSRSLRGFQAKR